MAISTLIRHSSRLADARTLAILPTHLGGRIADVERACEVARGAGAWVIEDAAQALGARVGNSSVGLRGDIGFFSLAAGKGLSLHEGGLLVSRDDELRAALAEHAAEQVRFSLRWELLRSVQLLGLAACYRPSLLSLVYGNPLRSALQRGDLEDAVGDIFPLDIPSTGSVSGGRTWAPTLHGGCLRSCRPGACAHCSCVCSWHSCRRWRWSMAWPAPAAPGRC